MLSSICWIFTKQLLNLKEIKNTSRRATERKILGKQNKR